MKSGHPDEKWPVIQKFVCATKSGLLYNIMQNDPCYEK